MQKEFYFDNKPESDTWGNMWTIRSIEQELEACDIESPPRELFLSYLPKGSRVLDAGCGLGKWVIYLKRLGYDIVGIDNSELAIAQLKDFDESLQVEQGDILGIDYPDNSFDAYISMGVIEHFEDGPAPALKEAYRVLKPNGLMFVSVPTVNIIRKIVRRPLRNSINALVGSLALLVLKSAWGRDALLVAIRGILPRKRGMYYHFLEYRYSKTEMENFLRQSNFEVIEIVPHDHYGSRDHAIGLVVDFPFLAARNGVNFRVNFVGKLISGMLDRISPWIACSSVLCVGRSLKKYSALI